MSVFLQDVWFVLKSGTQWGLGLVAFHKLLGYWAVGRPAVSSQPVAKL